MKRYICAVMVTVFSILGMATLADRMDSNASRNAQLSGKCDSKPVCNGQKRS
jgi:hypothetical protein